MSLLGSRPSCLPVRVRYPFPSLLLCVHLKSILSGSLRQGAYTGLRLAIHLPTSMWKLRGSTLSSLHIHILTTYTSTRTRWVHRQAELTFFKLCTLVFSSCDTKFGRVILHYNNNKRLVVFFVFCLFSAVRCNLRFFEIFRQLWPQLTLEQNKNKKRPPARLLVL